MSDTKLREAYALHQAGRLEEAAEAYRQILQSNPNQSGPTLLLGLVHLQLGHFDEADRVLAGALRLNPNSVDGLSARAAALHGMGQREDALALLDRLLSLAPNHAVGWNNRGNLLLEMGRTADAMPDYGRALALQPDYAEAWHNRAVASITLGDPISAQRDLDRALQLMPNYPEALEHRALVLALQGRHSEALADYDAVLAISPDATELLKSRGALRNLTQRYADALADFDRVLSLEPDDAVAWQGRGSALARLNHDEEALASFSCALELRPKDPVSLYNRASLLSGLKAYEEALCDAEALLAIDPDFPLARGLAMHVKLQVCDWLGLEQACLDIAAALNAGKRAVYPFGHLAFSDSPMEQCQCARIYVRDSYPASSAPLWRGERYNHEKIRVAYISGDYYTHAIPFLIAGVLEHHDRDRFETFGISYSPDDGSPMRARLEKAFGQFIDIRERADADVAGMLRGLEIDIAVDLKGYTGGARPGILAHRPAPVQVQYLGYPGTMGADYIDYLIADRVVVPEKDRAHYAEQIVYLPDAYQSNDSRRRIGALTLTRAAAGLPADAFVFCCFNGSQKILPDTFRIWMRILAKVEKSLLWLLDEHPLTVTNLRREARAGGLEPDRLVFAKRVPLEKHLARLSLADLVLDTLPYGAHTTASDALWAGVPVLTRIGTTFAGRVASSLLSAVGIPELIAHSPAQYESLACEIARDRATLSRLKEKLARNRQTGALFDTARTTRNLEAAYTEMWTKQQLGERPAHFAVGDPPVSDG